LPRLEFSGQLIEGRDIARLIDRETADARSIDLLDARGIGIRPGHVIEGASREDFRVPMTRHALGDLQAMQFRAAIHLTATALNNKRNAHLLYVIQ
jgi:hypothetical protein